MFPLRSYVYTVLLALAGAASIVYVTYKLAGH
jgi:hypothetical protein